MTKNNQQAEAKLLAALLDFNKNPSSKRFSSMSSLLGKVGELNDQKLEEKIIYELLQTPSNFRNIEVCNRIMMWVQDLEYFHKITESYGEKARQKMFSSLTATYNRQGKQLIRVGEESDKFYIILRGEVMVLYIRNVKDVERDNAAIDRDTLKGMSKLQRIRAREDNAHLFRGVPIENLENYDHFFNSLGVPLYDIENTLNSGQSFGELGIIYRQKRMAHVLCKSDCLIATIAADKYMRFIAQKQEGSIHSMMQFLQQHFFTGIGDLQLKEAQRYLYLFTVAERKMNSIICGIREPVNGFYIVMEGQVTLKRQQEEPFRDRTNVDKCLKYFRDTRKRKLIQYKTLLPGQSFGLDEIMMKFSNQVQNIEFSYAVVATSNAKLLFCPITKIVKLLRTDKNLAHELAQRVTKLRSVVPTTVHHQGLRTFRPSITTTQKPSQKAAILQTLPSQHSFPQRHEIPLDARHLSIIRSSNHFSSNRKSTRYADSSEFNNYVFEPHVNPIKSTSRSRMDQSFGLTLEDSRVLTESLRRRLRDNEENLIKVLRDCKHAQLKRTCKTAKSQERRLRCN